MKVTSGKTAGGLLGTVAVGLGLAASIGAGYTVAHASLSDASAYVSKGTSISHVNGEARKVDATSNAVGRQGDNIDVVGLPGGKVVAVDSTTGTVTVQDGSTMTTTSTAHGGGDGRNRHAVLVVSSGSDGWLVDQDGSSVRRVVDGRVRAAIHLDDAPVDGAPGPDGSVIVLTTSGEVLDVDVAGKTHAVDTDKAPNGALTVARGNTYLVTTTGDIVQVDTGEPVKVASVNGPSTGPDGRMLVGSAASPGDHVLVAIPGGIVVVDPQTGQKFGISDRAGSDTLGQPVEYDGKVFVPDFSNHSVLVLDEKSETAQKPIKVPGSQPTFALFISGGRLWANDQYSQHLLEFDHGTPVTVSKGTGNGTKSDNPPKKTPPEDGKGGHGGTGGTGGTGPVGPTPVGGSSGGGGGTGSSGGSGSGGGGGGSGRPQYVRVPHFPPHTLYQQACQQISQLGPQCTPVSKDDTGTTDEVIDTVPAAGQKVATNGAVTVLYVGPTKVPNFPADTTPIEACNALQTAGLRCTLAPAAQPASDPTSYGTVSATEPAEGSQVDSGSPVTVRYFDSYRMPDYQSAQRKGARICDSLADDTLELPHHKPIVTQCAAVPGKQTVSRATKSQADEVYHQNIPAMSVYRPGADHSLRLTVYNANANLPDYRLSSGNQIAATDAVNDCSQWFECQLAQNEQVPLDSQGNVQVSWIGKVAAIHNPSGQDVAPNQPYHVGTGTHIRIVEYGGDQGQNNTVPDVSNQNFNQACATLRQAGFVCNAQNVPAKITDPNQLNNIYSEAPTGGTEAPLGSTVNVDYFNQQAVPLWLYHNTTNTNKGIKERPDDTGEIHVLNVGPNPAPPPGYALDGQVAWAWQPNAVNANWNLKQFQGDCGNINGNVLYSHGAPSGCLANDNNGIAAGVSFPADSSPSGDGSNCGWQGQGVWIWRVDYAPQGTPTGAYTVVLGTASINDVPNTPGYHEPVGCVFPPG